MFPNEVLYTCSCRTSNETSSALHHAAAWPAYLLQLTSTYLKTKSAFSTSHFETKEKELWPADALKDDQFMAQYYQLKLSGIAGPSNSPLSTASTIADLLASVVRPVPVLVNPLSGFWLELASLSGATE